MTNEDSQVPFTETEEFVVEMAHAMHLGTEPEPEQVEEALLSMAEPDVVCSRENKVNPHAPTRFELKQFPGSIVRVKNLNGGWLLQSIEGGGAPRDVSVACDEEEIFLHLMVALAFIKLRETSRRREQSMPTEVVT